MELVDRNKCALHIGDVVVTMDLKFAIIVRRTAQRIGVRRLYKGEIVDETTEINRQGSVLVPSNTLLAHPVCPEILHNAKIIRKLLKQ